MLAKQAPQFCQKCIKLQCFSGNKNYSYCGNKHVIVFINSTQSYLLWERGGTHTWTHRTAITYELCSRVSLQNSQLSPSLYSVTGWISLHPWRAALAMCCSLWGGSSMWRTSGMPTLVVRKYKPQISVTSCASLLSHCFSRLLWWLLCHVWNVWQALSAVWERGQRRPAVLCEDRRQRSK